LYRLFYFKKISYKIRNKRLNNLSLLTTKIEEEKGEAEVKVKFE